jgi:hypothetical protein
MWMATAAILYPEMDLGRPFHNRVILYGPDPFDAPCDFTRFIHGVLGINEAAQPDRALVGTHSAFSSMPLFLVGTSEP